MHSKGGNCAWASRLVTTGFAERIERLFDDGACPGFGGVCVSWKAFDESKSPDVSFQELFPAADLFAGSRSRPGSSNQLSKPAGSRDQQLDRVSCTPTVRLSEVVVTNSVCPSSQVIMKSREDMRLVNYSGKAATAPRLSVPVASRI